MDDIDVHDFIATHTPKGKSPKLDRYADAIFYLKERGFSDDDVLLFLSEKKGLVVGKRTLSRFLARDKKEKPAQNTIKSTAQNLKLSSLNASPLLLNSIGKKTLM